MAMAINYLIIVVVWISVWASVRNPSKCTAIKCANPASVAVGSERS